MSIHGSLRNRWFSLEIFLDFKSRAQKSEIKVFKLGAYIVYTLARKNLSAFTKEENLENLWFFPALILIAN